MRGALRSRRRLARDRRRVVCGVRVDAPRPDLRHRLPKTEKRRGDRSAVGDQQGGFHNIEGDFWHVCRHRKPTLPWASSAGTALAEAQRARDSSAPSTLLVHLTSQARGGGYSRDMGRGNSRGGGTAGPSARSAGFGPRLNAARAARGALRGQRVRLRCGLGRRLLVQRHLRAVRLRTNNSDPRTMPQRAAGAAPRPARAGVGWGTVGRTSCSSSRRAPSFTWQKGGEGLGREKGGAAARAPLRRRTRCMRWREGRAKLTYDVKSAWAGRVPACRGARGRRPPVRPPSARRPRARPSETRFPNAPPPLLFSLPCPLL